MNYYQNEDWCHVDIRQLRVMDVKTLLVLLFFVLESVVLLFWLNAGPVVCKNQPATNIKQIPINKTSFERQSTRNMMNFSFQKWKKRARNLTPASIQSWFK